MAVVVALVLTVVVAVLLYQANRWHRRRSFALGQALAPPGWTLTLEPRWELHVDVRGVHRGRPFVAHVTNSRGQYGTVDLVYQPTPSSPGLSWIPGVSEPPEPGAADARQRRRRLAIRWIEAPIWPGPVVRATTWSLTAFGGRVHHDRLQAILDELVAIAESLEAGRPTW